MQQQHGHIINSRKQFLLRGSTKIIVEFFGEKILNEISNRVETSLFLKNKRMLINALCMIAFT